MACASQHGAPRRQTFSKADRLTCKKQYDEVFAQGEKVVGRHFVCYWVRQCGQGCRLGLVVSRKVGKAVVRNRLKRYIREFFRTEREYLESDLQLVVVARAVSKSLDGRQSAASLRSLLQQGGVYHG